MLKFGLSRRSGVAVVALVGVSLASAPAWAQDSGQPPVPGPQSPAVFNPNKPDFFERLQPSAPEPVAPALYRVEFPIRNIKASLAAYWLDPAHQPMPVDLRISGTYGEPYRGVNPYFETVNGVPKPVQLSPRLPGNGNGPVGLKLPEGISRIVAVDPQNKILAFGTKEGLKALSVLLPTLDVPLRQYEIEAQFLSLRRADLGALGLDFGEVQGQSPLSFGAVAAVGKDRVQGAQGLTVGYLQGPIAKLIGEGRVKVISAPRVTAIDGLTAQLEMSTTTPFVLTTPAAKAEGKEARMEQSVAFVKTSIGMRATPVRVKDDLISLSVTPMLITRSLSVNTTVRDGQSFAIQMSPATDENQIVVIVTTRFIRRAGDDA